MVPYTNLSRWEYQFTGIPLGIDLSSFSRLHREDLNKLAKKLNAGTISLIKRQTSS